MDPFFRFAESSTLSPVAFSAMQEQLTNAPPEMFLKSGDRALAFGVTAQTVNTSTLQDQFIVFQFNRSSDGQPILETSQMDPELDGGIDAPDVQVNLNLLSLQIGMNESIAENAKATMRLNLGKDPSSSDRYFDVVTWSIAAGLQLYDDQNGKRAAGKDLASNMSQVFRNRPIEIPGGLAKMSFEVVKHTEPPWWKKIFQFATSEPAKRLVSVLGFPAITNDAIRALDELFNRIEGAQNPKPLFYSRPMTLALSKHAKTEFTGGLPHVAVGSLSPGYCILARGRDFGTILDAKPKYYAQYEKLVPAAISERDLVTGNYTDPFTNVTYAVFRIAMRKAKLDPNVSLVSG